MTQSNQSKPILDNSFSAFIAGLTVGIAGALLLGTEEGKKISKKALDSIPEDITKLFSETKPEPVSPPPQVTPSPNTFASNEAPPPPPPLPPVKPFPKTTDNFFTSKNSF